MNARLILPLLLAVAGCWGNCSFEDLACQNPPPPDPCGDARRVVAGGQLIGTDDGGAFALSFEGRGGVDLVVRRIDAQGALSWSVPLAYIGSGMHLFAVGDTLMIVTGDDQILGLRDGAIAFSTSAPEAPVTVRCNFSSAVVDGDGLEVVGWANGVSDDGGAIYSETLVACSYRVGRDGSVGAALVFGKASYQDGGFIPGALPGIAVSTGGYAIGTADALQRYDANGALLWQDAIVWPGPIVESGGILFVLAGAADLERIRADGTSDPAVVSWPVQSDFRVLDILPVARGVVVWIEQAQGDTLALVGEHGLLWQAAPRHIDHLSTGATHFVVVGADLRDFDLDGNMRWTRAQAVAAFAAADGSSLIFDRTTVDSCAEAATISRVGGDGAVAWSATFPQ